MTNNKYARFPRSAFVGFDHIFRELEDMTKHATDHYPPHNIIQTSEGAYRIEIACAGFSEDELSAELKDGVLHVTGEHESRNLEFVHKGISTRKFDRAFRLSEYTQVVGASLVNGILAIELEVVLPEEKKPRKIDIINRLPEANKSELLTESA